MNAQLAPLTNQSGEFLTKGGVFVDGGAVARARQHACPAANAWRSQAFATATQFCLLRALAKAWDGHAPSRGE
jgi:hypothetical protein